ncbi:MAG: hypothetical protein H6680_08250 [Desulfobacteraceae bacterium]|nr:hypothetical protein [Desulfobacteraceae bacterium]
MTAVSTDNSVFSEIEKLLIRENVVSEQDISKAKSETLAFNKKSMMPLGLILAKENGLGEAEVAKILNNPSLYEKSAEIIKKDISLKTTDISQMIKKNDSAARLLTELAQKNIISANKKNALLNKILNLKITATTLADMGLVPEDALEAAFRKKKKKMSLCEILYEQHLVTLSELNHIFITLDSSLKLGKILENLGLINDKILDETLKEQSKSGMSLGAILVNKNKISVQQLYFALSIQYNIPFRQLSNFTYSDAQKIELRTIIDRKSAEQNLIIPVLLSGENLMLGVYNPCQIADINDIMSKYGNLKISCVLITHNKFEQLYALLYGEILNTTNNLIAKGPAFYEKKTLISDPDSQYRIINDLYEKYIRLGKDKKGSTFNPDRVTFHDFIKENYLSICSKYNCNHVSFWFNASNENINIMASPVLSKS